MIVQLEERLSRGFQFMELNQKKWFMKPNGTIFALEQQDSENSIVVLYADTVMNAAIRVYDSSEPVSLEQEKEDIFMQLSQIILSI